MSADYKGTDFKATLKGRIFEAVVRQIEFKEITMKKNFPNKVISESQQNEMCIKFFDELTEREGDMKGLIDIRVDKYSVLLNSDGAKGIPGYDHIFTYKYKFISSK